MENYKKGEKSDCVVRGENGIDTGWVLKTA